MAVRDQEISTYETQKGAGKEPHTNAENRQAYDNAEVQSVAQQDTSDIVGGDNWLLKQAQSIYTTSTDYMDSNITNVWEKNISHFHNQHAPGTPYGGRNFKRSSVFRPKTRANTKSQEAKLAVAMFGSQDLLIVSAEDKTDETQVASAKINKTILQYRMEKRMPWVLTALGGYQDTKVYGVNFSHQYWRYEVDENIVPELNGDGSPVLGKGDDGKETPMGRKVRIIRRDDLCCDLIAPENFRFDPMADWRDPINTSPYLIYMVPIYAGDALERMEMKNPRTDEPFWRSHKLSELLATRRDTYNRTRQAREGRERIDPADEQTGNEFTVLWAHMNIMRVSGEDYVWWTMGTELVLTPMVRLIDEYPWLNVGERPFTMGVSSLEAHRNYPAGDIEQGSGLQEEINTVANQRLDNVKLVLNKRYYVRRGSQTDLDALMRNVPGGGVMMNDPAKDVVTVNTPDVTNSSYEEQDRLANEHDSLVGAFDSASIQANRQLGDTAKGMEMLGSSAGTVQDYSMSLFIMTWVEKTLYQFIRLIQMYETDEMLLALAAKEAEVWQRFGSRGIDDDMMRKSLTVNVNVGVGNTDPVRRVERLTYGVNQAAGLPGMLNRIKSDNIANEIFSALGYRNADSYFRSDEEQAEYEQANPPQPSENMQIKGRELDIREQDNQMRDKRESRRIELENIMHSDELAQARRNKADSDAAANNLKRVEISDKRDIEGAKIADRQRSEMMKIASGGGGQAA